MALVKCKECGHEISKSAKSCPNCGAKIVRTSGFTKLIAFFMILGLIGYISSLVNQNERAAANKATTSSNSSSSSTTASTKAKEPPKPSWHSFDSKDEMTGAIKAFATSDRVSPNRQMTFPYSDVRSWMGFGCDKKSEWAYIGFTTAPNLNNKDTESGYYVISTRIKWDEAVSTGNFIQQWGDKFLNFQNSDAAISKIMASNKLRLELDWHGQQPVYFDYKLNGSSKAIAEARAICKSAK